MTTGDRRTGATTEVRWKYSNLAYTIAGMDGRTGLRHELGRIPQKNIFDPLGMSESSAANYGYPIVSNGDHYDGREIPDHDTHPEFEKPAVWWTPVISPGHLMIYRGQLFSDWRGDALVAGLSSRAIVRVELDFDRAREVERYDMGARIRSVVEGPNGALWVLEDDEEDSTGRLLKLTPKR